MQLYRAELGEIKTHDTDQQGRQHTNLMKFLDKQNISVDVKYLGYTGDEYSYGASVYMVSLKKE
jgi:proline racemase